MLLLNRTIIVKGISLLFIFLFTYTALSKILSFAVFQIQLQLNPLLSAYASFLSWFIILTEIIITILLFFRQTNLLGLFGALLLMLAFTTYISILFIGKYDLPCTCGGLIKNLSWTNHLILNSSLTILASCAIWLSVSGKNVIAVNRTSRKPV